jgi:type IV secretory pathway TraG/TraD family ATPase VirD4
MLDEFFALGHMEIISTVWALVRGYGIQIMPILQDLGQLKKLYPDMWRTFLGMAGAITSFAAGDDETADWLSKLCGETTRKIKSLNETFSTNTGTSIGSNQGSSTNGQLAPSGSSSGSSEGKSNGSSRSTSLSTNLGKVPLITAHQLRGLKPGYMILSLAGLAHIVPAYAPAYHRINKYRERDRMNPYFPDATRRYNF